MKPKTFFIIFAVALVIFIAAKSCSSDGSSSSGGSSNRCTICNSSATNTFQGSGYCDKHYKDAINWALDNVSWKTIKKRDAFRISFFDGLRSGDENARSISDAPSCRAIIAVAGLWLCKFQYPRFFILLQRGDWSIFRCVKSPKVCHSPHKSPFSTSGWYTAFFITCFL